MANNYCASSFMLPSSWTVEAKEMFTDLVQGVSSYTNVRELEELFAKHDVDTKGMLLEQFLDTYFKLEVEIIVITAVETLGFIHREE